VTFSKFSDPFGREVERAAFKGTGSNWFLENFLGEKTFKGSSRTKRNVEETSQLNFTTFIRTSKSKYNSP